VLRPPTLPELFRSLVVPSPELIPYLVAAAASPSPHPWLLLLHLCHTPLPRRVTGGVRRRQNYGETLTPAG
jgi:hypothetical protein